LQAVDRQAGIRQLAERLAGERRQADRTSGNTEEACKKATVSKSFKVLGFSNTGTSLHCFLKRPTGLLKKFPGEVYLNDLGTNVGTNGLGTLHIYW
jgi:hypothetical protein